MVMKLIEELERYVPYNEQEEKDRELILHLLRTNDDIFKRENTTAHMTASAWVVSPDHKKVLMAYHNLYDSWAWLGGHCDGQTDLLNTAIREVTEESGLKHVRPYITDIFSLEVLTVDGHVKKGKYVSSHLHLNVTYLLEAYGQDEIRHTPDENKAVGWFDPEEVYVKSSEPWFVEHIYRKLNEKMAALFAKNDI